MEGIYLNSKGMLGVRQGRLTGITSQRNSYVLSLPIRDLSLESRGVRDFEKGAAPKHEAQVFGCKILLPRSLVQLCVLTKAHDLVVRRALSEVMETSRSLESCLLACLFNTIDLLFVH
jgi:hypothetical protein